MTNKKRKALPFALIQIATLIVSVIYSGSAFSIIVTDTNLKGNGWLSEKDEISIVINRENGRSETELKFVLGKNDISALFKQKETNLFVYSPSILPLPRGISSLKVYEVQEDDSWKEIAEYPVQVKTLFGFKESEVTSSVNVNIKSEIDSGFKGDAIAPPTDQLKQTSMTTNISYNSNSTVDNFNLRTNFNLIGVSKYEEALQFSEKGYDANKLDLSDYLIEMNNGKNNISIGHINFGQNRYLINGFGSRGISYKGSYGDDSPLDFSFAKMNGRNIVGYSNITGLNGASNNSVVAATIGYEFITSRPGGVRAEFSYLDASILAANNFDTGEIVDAEKSSGYGMKLTGINEAGTFRGEMTYALSKYTNPSDPLLFQGDNIVEVAEQTDSARYAEFSYEIFRSQPDESGNSYGVTLSASHERVDPLYKSLAAFAGADTQTNITTVDIQLGAISVQLNANNNEDNIEDLETVLKTKTDTKGANISVPFKQIFSVNGEENNLIPNLDIQANSVHQYGANRPTTFDPDTHIPDQFNTTKTYSLNWNAEKLSVSYTYGVSNQDNRQIGRSNSDFKNVNKSINVGYQFTSSLDINLGASKVKAIDYENDLITYDDNYSLGFNWGITEKLRLTTSYSEAQTNDSQINATRNDYSGNAQLSWQFDMSTTSGKKMPGQFFIGYSMQNNRSKNNVFNSQTNAQSWTINTGLNMSLF